MHSHLNQFSDFIDSIKSKSKCKDGLVSGVTAKQIVPLNLLINIKLSFQRFYNVFKSTTSIKAKEVDLMTSYLYRNNPIYVRKQQQADSESL